MFVYHFDNGVILCIKFFREFFITGTFFLQMMKKPQKLEPTKI